MKFKCTVIKSRMSLELTFPKTRFTMSKCWPSATIYTQDWNKFNLMSDVHVDVPCHIVNLALNNPDDVHPNRLCYPCCGKVDQVQAHEWCSEGATSTTRKLGRPKSKPYTHRPKTISTHNCTGLYELPEFLGKLWVTSSTVVERAGNTNWSATVPNLLWAIWINQWSWSHAGRQYICSDCLYCYMYVSNSTSKIGSP